MNEWMFIDIPVWTIYRLLGVKQKYSFKKIWWKIVCKKKNKGL